MPYHRCQTDDNRHGIFQATSHRHGDAVYTLLHRCLTIDSKHKKQEVSSHGHNKVIRPPPNNRRGNINVISSSHEQSGRNIIQAKAKCRIIANTLPLINCSLQKLAMMGRTRSTRSNNICAVITSAKQAWYLRATYQQQLPLLADFTLTHTRGSRETISLLAEDRLHMENLFINTINNQSINNYCAPQSVRQNHIQRCKQSVIWSST